MSPLHVVSSRIRVVLVVVTVFYQKPRRVVAMPLAEHSDPLYATPETGYQLGVTVFPIQ